MRVRYCERITRRSSSFARGSVHPEKSIAPPDIQNFFQCWMLFCSTTLKSPLVPLTYLLKETPNSNSSEFFDGCRMKVCASFPLVIPPEFQFIRAKYTVLSS